MSARSRGTSSRASGSSGGRCTAWCATGTVEARRIRGTSRALSWGCAAPWHVCCAAIVVTMRFRRIRRSFDVKSTRKRWRPALCARQGSLVALTDRFCARQGPLVAPKSANASSRRTCNATWISRRRHCFGGHMLYLGVDFFDDQAPCARLVVESRQASSRRSHTMVSPDSSSLVYHWGEERMYDEYLGCTYAHNLSGFKMVSFRRHTPLGRCSGASRNTLEWARSE